MPTPTLILGATGATGRLLTRQLLERGHRVRAVVRSRERLVDTVGAHDALEITEADLHSLSDADLARHVQGCGAIASCLGHNLNWKGIYGEPRRLVTDAVRRVCEAIQSQQPTQPVKVVLMNTAGCRNRDLDEPVSFPQKCVVGLIRALLPPHVDNEQAADFLRTQVGPRHNAVEWSVVRPDTLIDANDVTPYDAHPSPTRSAIFNPGKTSRINVAHFMAELIDDSPTWQKWKAQMPVIYNREAGA
ncbi:MAG: NAD(P)-dependent oxidoreductase [Puniceicoccales bacterium]